jgi:hypothetical protein
MKKIIFLALCVLAAAGSVFAQPRNKPGPDDGTAFTPPAEETIRGNLGLSAGMISLESGGTRYYVMGLLRFVGFIDGLKEGAAVSLKGYAFDSPRLPGAKIFRPVEMQLNAKSYELAPPADFSGPGNGGWGDFPHHRNFRFRDGGPGDWDRGPGHQRQGGNGNGPDRRAPRRN